MSNPAVETAQKINTPNSWLFCIGLIILFIIPYSVVNHLPLHRKTLPFIWSEERIPFLPWTFVIYLSAFLQALLVARYLPKPLLFKTVQLLAIAVVAGLLLFVLLPIRYPREMYITSNHFITGFQKVDSDGNCFPSLHVAMTLVFAFCYSLTVPSYFWRACMWLWTMLIIMSVLTTKQHYLADVFGGIALALPIIFILRNRHSYQALQ